MWKQRYSVITVISLFALPTERKLLFTCITNEERVNKTFNENLRNWDIHHSYIQRQDNTKPPKLNIRILKLTFVFFFIKKKKNFERGIQAYNNLNENFDRIENKTVESLAQVIIQKRFLTASFRSARLAYVTKNLKNLGLIRRILNIQKFCNGL